MAMRKSMQPSRDGLVVRTHPRSPAAEAFRMIRTNLEFLGANGRSRVWLLTSPGAREGKSTVAANLALTVAATGRRTLLVDADLRRPVQHRLFQLDNRRGLSSVLTGAAGWRDCLQPVGSDDGEGASHLDVLTSGPLPPNPAELLQLQEWKGFLAEVREAYPIVFIDAPPVLFVTDAQVMATDVDRVLLIARSGYTRKDALSEACRALDRSGVKNLAVVLNRVSQNDTYGYYAYYERRE